jgi:hypothetical protein
MTNYYEKRFQKRKKNDKATLIYSGGFVTMENELLLYNLLGYSEDPSIRVTPATLDVYRALKQHQNHSDDSEMYGKAWISIERLALKLAINRKTCAKHLTILENVGLLRIRRFYRGGRKHTEFNFGHILTEAEFKAKYPEVIAIFNEKMKETERDSDVEPWYKPKKEAKDE